MATFFGTAGLTFVVWLTQSLRFMDYLVNRGLPLADFVGLVGMLLPAFLLIVLPVAIFISTLFVYNKLIGDNELVVMRAAGFSAMGLARPVLVCGGLVAMIVYFISLYLMPIAYREFKDRQFALRHDLAALVLREGTFQKV
ncbi:MAG: LptF/LptG family permease, partial [Pseudomonadota bacterium]